MAQVNGSKMWRGVVVKAVLALATVIPAIPGLQAQSGGSQTQSQPPANPQPAQDIPDAPSTVQPPPPAKPAPSEAAPGASKKNEPIPFPGDVPKQPNQSEAEQNQAEEQQSQQPASSFPAGASQPKGPRNQINPKQDLYTISVPVSFVQIPVMVKDSDGRRVDGLLPKDFIVKENGKPQTLSYFTSDPFELSVAVILDIGMPDVALQKVNQTYTALAGAFSPYDEVALYTYSSTVSQVTDFTGKPQRLIAALSELKQVRGNNGPPVLGGPLGPGGPTVNGAPVGGPVIQPVNTPPKESHVLNDAILRAALDLSKRERTRRKVIFVISDGRELGSRASYNDVRRLLQTRDIQVRAVVVDSGALPAFRQLGKLHLPGQGTNVLLPKYVSATCGEEDLDRLSRNAIEDAYAQITNEARNQYTLGYSPKPTTGASPYRAVEVVVDKKGLKVTAKDGYYPTPSAR